MALPTAQHGSGQVHALLGPTNTGKTRLAIERMLKHPTGMIGLPLRLLAREVFDRVCEIADPQRVALITGEERIVGPANRYWICTVEAMPVSRSVDFLAVDEIQLAADRDRGHVFTDRILHARGKKETLFLGSETIAPLLRRLAPGLSVETRARLSALSYLGPRKLSRLPRRSAVIAYRAEEVYGVAEFLRRQKGGAAVVMGALSPRTRNAQVALFESGEVDYLVATDAIGMGLNLNIDHVAFASLRKFDGAITRRLAPAEIGQVAGRAGRYLNPGTFGTTGEALPIDEELVAAVESHQYRSLRRLRYRSSNLDLSSVPGLMTSLNAPPRFDFLLQAPEADDLKALRQLYQEADIAKAVRSPTNVSMLWRVCGIPDFQQMLHETHVNLLGGIFRHLINDAGQLPSDFLANHIRSLDSVQGDIDTLQTRLAHIRTWTYVAHQEDWLNDPVHWQQTAQEVENRLSDALHQRLIQRFVDRQHAATLRRLQEAGTLSVAVDPDGAVRLDDSVVGTIEGLHFTPTTVLQSSTKKLLRRELRTEFADRASQLAKAGNDAFALRNATLLWRGEAVAKLQRSGQLARPRLQLLVDDTDLSRVDREQLRKRLEAWLESERSKALRPIEDLQRLSLGAVGRGLVFRLSQSLGVIERPEDLLNREAQVDVRRLKKAGVVFGHHFVFIPALLRPRRAKLAGELLAIHGGVEHTEAPPGRVSVDKPSGVRGTPPHGFRSIGQRWYRVDAIERLAEKLMNASGSVTVTGEHLSLVGAPRQDFFELATFLGFRRDQADETRLIRRSKTRGHRKQQRKRRTVADSTSPFAVLESLRDSPGP